MGNALKGRGRETVEEMRWISRATSIRVHSLARDGMWIAFDSSTQIQPQEEKAKQKMKKEKEEKVQREKRIKVIVQEMASEISEWASLAAKVRETEKSKEKSKEKEDNFASELSEESPRRRE